MRCNRLVLAGLVTWLVTGHARADELAGKFAFDWHSLPDTVRCAKLAGPLLAEMRSAKFRCDPKVVSNTSTGASARVCTERKGKREYLIFNTLRACESERKTQASNE